MTEIATIDWFGRWGTSFFSENTAIFQANDSLTEIFMTYTEMFTLYILYIYIYIYIYKPCHKKTFAICKQQRRRSACASVQSDQHLCCSLPG